MFLGVNIDHIATIRQARRTDYPDPVAAALACIEQGGADGIVAHLREDRRHIHDTDMQRLASISGLHLNMEMAATNEMVAICESLLPAACCLVPEKREELTTEGGLDVVAHKARLASIINRLHNAGVEVSLFIDADLRQIETAAEIGARVIELHTGHYADSSGQPQQSHLAALRAAARMGHELGLRVNAGHGLTLANTPAIVAIPEIVELNIGHAIVADALFSGIGPAVQAFKRIMQR